MPPQAPFQIPQGAATPAMETLLAGAKPGQLRKFAEFMKPHLKGLSSKKPAELQSLYKQGSKILPGIKGFIPTAAGKSVAGALPLAAGAGIGAAVPPGFWAGVKASAKSTGAWGIKNVMPIAIGLTLVAMLADLYEAQDYGGFKAAGAKGERDLTALGVGVLPGGGPSGLEPLAATGERALNERMLPILAQQSQGLDAALLNSMSPGTPRLPSINTASDDVVIGGGGDAGNADLIAMLQQMGG